MKTSIAAALALVAVVTLAPCSAATSHRVASTSTAAVPLYPGAVPAERSSYGTPPPGGKLYVSSDDPVTVAKWYLKKGAEASAPATAKGALLLFGDPNTGNYITLIGEGGKTYIQILPVSPEK
jgi:hypothetical protein